MDSTKKSLDHLTFADLRVHYGTGRAFLIRQEYRRNVYGYRKGVKTDLGDLEEKDWIQLATGLILKSGEQQLQKNLLEWEQEHNYCKSSPKEMEMTALELHMARIFDDPLWVPISRSTGSIGRRFWNLPDWYGFKQNAVGYPGKLHRSSWNSLPEML